MDSPANTFNPNKRLKEESVSNLKGTSMMELFLLITTLSMLLFLRSVYSSSKKETLSKKDDNVNAVVCKKNMGSYHASATLDVLCIVFPVILCLTLSVLYLDFLFLRKRGSDLLGQISAYRVAMNFLTCICILAVDFKIFPRRYAKTETYGTGLMDIGVGLFIVANALVSRQAHVIAKMNLRNAISSTCPFIVLGFARIFFTSSVDYQWVVVRTTDCSDWQQWRLWFRMVVVGGWWRSIMMGDNGGKETFVQHFSKKGKEKGRSLLYEVILLLGLNEYLLSNERGHDIISQNKEGIFSIFGKVK
ncbi:hypothetical protein H5410_043131 [Solanum commersonii]|uniref:Uncharacterized protein n=1 Tax=Solanum commersonii TaxID=4109 RepID=A0A9J5XWP8_SOLCO|nr:hypothetical protein H5410_043131 [Solanum commersonii]